MFYLTKFCRICIRASGPLIDIDSEDADAVKISDKLRYVRARMVISEEEHCRLMCYECVQKLRVSYLFQKQCTKADKILERYLNEITSSCPGRKFVNSELKVTIVPISQVDVKEEVDLRSDQDAVKCNKTGASGFSAGSFNYTASISVRPRSKLSTSTGTSVKPTRFRRRLKQEASFRISEAYKDRIRRLRRVCPRITKQQRCMLLKSLLTKNDHNSNTPVSSRKSRKYLLYHSRQKNQQPFGCSNKTTMSKIVKPKNKMEPKSKGGLRDLLGFIKCYDFGFSVEECDITEQCDNTVLDRLESFSRTFFYNDFQAYRETILSLANDSESSDDDEMFEPYDEEEDRLLWPECNLGNCNNNCDNNVTIKKEIDDSSDGGNDTERIIYPNIQVKVELEPEYEQDELSTVDDRNYPDTDADGDLLPSALVQACYEHLPTTQPNADDSTSDHPVKPLPQCLKQKINQGFQHFMNKIKTNLSSQTHELSDPATIVNHINRISVIPEASTSSNLSSLDLLTRLTNSTRLAKDAPKANAPMPTRCHLKCRTRGNPFINPQLMQQFQTRTFKCDTCNRSFKSPGYLHSHCTKMGH